MTALNYALHQWNICGDLKVINMLMGLQKGYIKYLYFLCLWDSRADSEHYTPDSRITNASWLLISFGIHIFYANHDIEYPNEDFFANQVNLVCEDT